MKRRLLPQRFALPSAREAHGGDVDGRVSGEHHRNKGILIHNSFYYHFCLAKIVKTTQKSPRQNQESGCRGCGSLPRLRVYLFFTESDFLTDLAEFDVVEIRHDSAKFK